jgi:hypothetical protein
MVDEREKLEGLNTKELVEKIKDGTIEAGDLDRIFFRAHRVTVEHALRILPGSLDYIMKQAMTLKNLSKEFYDRNSDLVNEKGLVAQLVEKVESDNPGLPYDKVLDQVEKIAKRRMGDLKDLKKHTKGVKKGKFDLDDLDTRLGEL